MKILAIMVMFLVLSVLPARADSSLMDEFTREAREYEKLYAAGDAAALAEEWTEDGIFVTSDGMRYRGRKDIESFFSRILAEPHHAKIKIHIDSIQEFGGGRAAIEEGTTSIGDQDEPAARYTVLHVHMKDGWKVAWVEEKLLPQSFSIDDLAWLCGTWKASGSEGKGLTLTVKKVQNGRFLEATTGERGARQVIGYDPNLNRLVSWHFDSLGGFGRGVWERIGNRWEQQSKGLMPDGSACSATYSVVPLSKDSFLIQSTRRFVGELELPVNGAVKMERMKETGAK